MKSDEANLEKNEIPHLNLYFLRYIYRGINSCLRSSALAQVYAEALPPDPDKTITQLEGLLHDQAELSGVLETLHGLHLPIIKVEQIDDRL